MLRRHLALTVMCKAVFGPSLSGYKESEAITSAGDSLAELLRTE